MRALEYPEPMLTDGYVRLRPWTLNDVACVEEASADVRIPEGTTVPVEYSDDEGRAFIERQWSRLTNGEGLSLAIAKIDDDRAIGLIVLMRRAQNGVVGVGYWVVASMRGRQYATRAVRLLSDWALHEVGIGRLEAWVEPDNLASQRLLEATGFVFEGRLRSFLSFPTRRADALSFSRIPGDQTKSTVPHTSGSRIG